MTIRTIGLLALLFLSYHSLLAQKLTLEECLSRAESISPLSRQKLEYETMDALTQKNISNGYLPTFAINGQASYQSDVFLFPKNPAFDSPIIPKDQYRLTLDINQKLYDGGMTKSKKIAESARIDSESKSVDVDLHEIKSSIVQLFFSALIYQENIRILQNLLGELRKQNDIIEAQVKNGLVLKSNSLIFNMQLLTTEQQILSAELEQRALLDMLSKWIDTDITMANQLQIPDTQLPIHESEINRPEIQLLKSQNLYMESMKKLSSVGNRPMLWAVAQAGVGQPNTYNMLETDFSDFYFVGLKLSWQLFDYGNARRERDIYTAKQVIVNSKLDFFEDNIGRQLTREYAEVDKLNELISKDDEILDMQKEIVESAFSQLNNGVITSTEYMAELNKKTQLELNRQIHLVQLKQAQYKCMNISGNL